jgi:uncharacterized damage-inducible protein DinB
MKHIARPESSEYAPYWHNYVKEVPDGASVLQFMLDNLHVVEDFVRAFPPERLTAPHAQGEWTIQDILVHVTDAERVFNYRALRFARNDPTELPGFDQNVFALWTGANQRSIDDILEERRAVRMGSITLFNGFDDEALVRTGVASGNRFTVRAFAYFIAGHEVHHLKSIRENYGAVV